jgi:hypothetical protein
VDQSEWTLWAIRKASVARWARQVLAAAVAGRSSHSGLHWMARNCNALQLSHSRTRHLWRAERVVNLASQDSVPHWMEAAPVVRTVAGRAAWLEVERHLVREVEPPVTVVAELVRKRGELQQAALMQVRSVPYRRIRWIARWPQTRLKLPQVPFRKEFGATCS